MRDYEEGVMGLSAKEVDQFLEFFENRNLSKAFGLLSKHPDLRFAELPRVQNQTLKQIHEDPQTLKEFCLGLAHPSRSVRSFCKKNVPRTGPNAAHTVLALALESIDPFRPAGNEALLGSFSGYASPVAEHIEKTKMKTKFRAPASYSEASRYAKEVIENVSDVLRSLRLDLIVLLKEFTESYARSPMDEEDLERRSWDPRYFQARDYRESDILYHELYGKVDSFLDEEAKEGNPALVRATEHWSIGKLLLEEEAASDEAVAALKSRFESLRETDKVVSRRRVRFFAEKLLVTYPKQQRIDLFHQILKGLESPGLPERELQWAEGRLMEYLEKFPNEVKAIEFQKRMEARKIERELELKKQFLTDPERLQAYEALGFSRKSVEKDIAELQSRLAQLASDAETDTKRGPRVESVCLCMTNLASDLNLPGIWMAIADEMTRKYLKAPEGGGSSKIERVLKHYAELAKRYEEQEIIPEAELQNEQIAEAFFKILKELALANLTTLKELRSKGKIPTPSENHTATQKLFAGEFGVLERTLEMALFLLPEKYLTNWATFWQKEVGLSEEHFFKDTFDQLIDAYESRNVNAVPLFKVLLKPGKMPMAGHESWQMLMAMLYRRNSPEAHKAVRELIRLIPLPVKKNMYPYDRWNEPYQWLLSRGWERQDSELFAAALERCALSFYKKGTKTLLPIVEHLRKDTFVPYTRITDESYSLEDVWNLVREKETESIPRILKTAFATIEFEKLPRDILPLAAKTGELDSTYFEDVLGLLESSQGPVCSVGCTVIKINPSVTGGKLALMRSAFRRMFASSSSGAARDAADLLGILGFAFPDQKQEAGEILFSALKYNNPALQEQVLKSLKKIHVKVSGKHVKTIQDLRKKNPRRFGKLCDALL